MVSAYDANEGHSVIPHTVQMMSSGFEMESRDPLWEEAGYALSKKDFHVAERLYRRLLMRADFGHSPDNVETLSILIELIRCLEAQFLFKEAELYRKRVQEYFSGEGTDTCAI